MKDKIFGVLQRIGRSFMLPIAILPVAGLLLGIGSSFTNETTIATYGLGRILGEGTVLHALLVIMNRVGSAIFDNLSLLFAVGVAIGMAKKEKEVAALSAVIAFFVMNTSINAMLVNHGEILENGTVAEDVLEGTIASVCGIMSLQTGVFGGIIVGLGVAALHNRFYKIILPNALSFFGGTRFVPIISTLVYMLVGIVMYFVWPVVQNGIYAIGGLVTGSGYIGTLIFGLVKRALIPFGLHHVFYMPFWHTALGGTMEVAGQLAQGGQNIFFAQLADSAHVTHFSADATRYFSGEFIFMIFGLPGAALAMYQCAKPEKKKAAGGLLFSAALTCMLTGITEPLEFSFLFVAPILFVAQVILAGTAYMVAHMLNIAVGLTFSGGLLDFFLFGILQGNEKTSWLRVIPVGIIYFFLYYLIFLFLIKKRNLKTPGREDGEEETRLYGKADVNKKQQKGNGQKQDTADNSISARIVSGLGGKENISDVDCCATRLRCTVHDAQRINDATLKATGASGVVHKGNGVQIIYGPNVTVIKSRLEEYLESGGQTEQSAENAEAEVSEDTARKEDGQSEESAENAGAGISEKTKKKDNGQPEEKKGKPGEGQSAAETGGPVMICSPMTGIAAELHTVPDEAFAGGMMGDGVCVTPTGNVVSAPEDGIVGMVFDTGHAIGYRTDSGIELLIHVGIDTVALGGKGFQVLVKSGQRLKKGEAMLRLDLDYIKAHAPSVTTPIVCTELADGQKVRLLTNGKVKAGQPLFVIEE